MGLLTVGIRWQSGSGAGNRTLIGGFKDRGPAVERLPSRIKVVRDEGVEPSSADPESAVLPIRRVPIKMVTLRGVEPRSPACHAGALPMGHSVVMVVEARGFEPRFLVCRTRVLPLDDAPRSGAPPRSRTGRISIRSADRGSAARDEDGAVAGSRTQTTRLRAGSSASELRRRKWLRWSESNTPNKGMNLARSPDLSPHQKIGGASGGT